MKRILVPTDFSSEAENGIQTAIPLARAFNATVVLLHVLEVSSHGSFHSSSDNIAHESNRHSSYIQEELKLAQDNLIRSVKLHGLDAEGIKYERYIRIGSPIKQIEESIKKEKIDFVIMGTKSVWGLDDILLGTSADKLLRKINLPVLSVNQNVSAETFKTIVLPTTTLNKETGLINIIKEFQKVFNSKIHLVRINTPQHFKPDKESQDLLKEYASKNQLINYKTHVYSHSEEEDGIRHFANIIGGGLIAVSTSAHTGLWKIIQGSVTKELLSHSTQPVLTMKMD